LSRPRTLAIAFGAALVALFVSLATYRLDRPGLYHDEVIFVPATLALIEDCAIDAPVALAPGCVPLLLEPPYVGGTKALLHAPVLAAFVVDVRTIRLPSILVSALALLVAFVWLERRVGLALAVTATLVLALDPAFVAHSRIDWGPFALANLAKLALLVCALRFVEHGSARAFAAALACAAFGLWDKINFVWVVGAFGVAALALDASGVARHVRAWPRRTRIALSSAAALLALVALYLVARALSLPVGDDAPAGFAARAARLWALLDHTFGGTSVLGWVTGEALAPPAWPAAWITAQLAVSVAVLVAVRGDGDKARVAPLRRALLFVTVAIGALLVALVVTPAAGGSHHIMVLWPLPVLQAALLVTLLRERFAPPAGRALVAGALIVAAALAVRHARVDRAYVDAWQHDRHAALFDPAIADLAARLAREDVDLVVSADWGLHHALVALAPAGQRTRYRDAWATLARSPLDPAVRRRDLRVGELADRRVAFVSHVPEATVMRATIEHVPEWLALWNACPLAQQLVSSRAGLPLYTVDVVGFGTACESGQDL